MYISLAYFFLPRKTTPLFLFRQNFEGAGEQDGVGVVGFERSEIFFVDNVRAKAADVGGDHGPAGWMRTQFARKREVFECVLNRYVIRCLFFGDGRAMRLVF